MCTQLASTHTIPNLPPVQRERLSSLQTPKLILDVQTLKNTYKCRELPHKDN